MDADSPTAGRKRMAAKAGIGGPARGSTSSQGRHHSGSVGSGKRNGTGGRVRTDSTSVDDDVELAVPEHKLRLDGPSLTGKKKVNPLRKHIKGNAPEVTGKEAFTYKKEDALDANDPNYDPEENLDIANVDIEVIEPDCVPLEHRKALEEPLKEFFDNGEFEDFIDNMLEIDTSEKMRISAVVVAVQQSLDRDDACRDLVSSLLVQMRTTHAVSDAQLVRAFDILLADMDDLALDNPQAVSLVSCFLGKAVADDILNPAYISARLDIPVPLARETVKLASVRINMPHGLVRLDSVWSAGVSRHSVTQLSEQIAIMLQEYLDSADLKEADRLIRAWNVPHFHHEIVFKAVILSLEYGNVPGEDPEAKVVLLMSLLSELTKSLLISGDQALLGFERVLKGLHDVTVDIPTAKRDIVKLALRGIEAGYLPASIEAAALEVSRE